MKPATNEWIQKAEGDFQTSMRELRARKYPNYDSACFHAQQCIEKYLKAFLTERGTPFPKIHDLLKLSELCSKIIPNLNLYESDLDKLSRYAVVFRYPGDFAIKDEASEAVLSMKRLRKLLREYFRLK